MAINSGEGAFISWSDRLATGIDLIDNQHKQLVNLTNELYQACLRGGDVLETAFKDTMSRMVDYVRFHFTTEQNMLQRVNYPNYAEHKQEHDTFIKTVLDSTRSHGDGKKFVPNNFVRFLRDWIITHIGHTDKRYAVYVAGLKRKGLLTDDLIEGR